MSFNCNSCGYRSNELKGGGAIPSYGTEVSCRITSPADLSRDVLKSDSCGVLIPELELELSNGTLGGVYTTVEGLLMKIHKQLMEQNGCHSGVCGFACSDALPVIICIFRGRDGTESFNRRNSAGLQVQLPGLPGQTGALCQGRAVPLHPHSARPSR